MSDYILKSMKADARDLADWSDDDNDRALLYNRWAGLNTGEGLSWWAECETKKAAVTPAMNAPKQVKGCAFNGTAETRCGTCLDCRESRR